MVSIKHDQNTGFLSMEDEMDTAIIRYTAGHMLAR